MPAIAADLIELARGVVCERERAAWTDGNIDSHPEKLMMTAAKAKV